MIMCVLLCDPVSIHMSQLLSTGRPVSNYLCFTSPGPNQLWVIISDPCVITGV